jgi:hypothetical protein
MYAEAPFRGMMTVQPLNETDLASLEPTTDAERHKRAMFMAAQTGRHAIELIRKMLNHCDTIDFEGGGALRDRESLSEGAHYTAMKELSALSIWLALAEQVQNGMPEWLKKFFADSWACADMLFDHPTSREVLDFYPATRELATTCETAALRLCHKLNVGNTTEDALIFVSDTLIQAADARAEILHTALTRTLPELNELIEQPVPI